MEEYLEFAKQIAYKAGEIMRKYFTSDNGSSYKYDNTIVTKADLEINSYLIEEVKRTFPDHAVVGEEESYGDSLYKWICDPVDGTAMYARHIPVAVFSLALAYEGNPIVGVVYDPFTDNLYCAAKGLGAYKNDVKINVSSYDLDAKESVSNFDMWPASEYNIFDVVKELGEKTYFVAIGSVIHAAMCVASGEFNLAIFPGTINKYCDIAAVKIIVEEAGGIVTDMFGDEQTYDKTINGAIISNKVVYNETLNCIKKHLVNKKEM